MSDLLVIGEALVDVVSTGAGREAHPGGSPLNVAVGLARLGASVTLATCIGTDEFGRILSGHLARSGVVVTQGSVDPSIRTSSATASIRSDGSAQYDFDITWDISAPRISSFRGLHTGSIGALLAPGGDIVAACFESAGPEILRSFDPNIRPSVLGPREQVLPSVERIARASTVVKLSDEDAEWLHPGLNAAEVTAHYARLGAALVVVTQGGAGSVLRLGAATAFVPAQTTKVADTIGAGDSYMAGLLFFLTTTVGSGTLLGGAMTLPDAVQAAAFAAACAAVTVSRPGADLPRLDEVAPASSIRFESENP
ncbi:carbohydrate kinase [Microbacterium sp. cx-55]|uniref:carbohydrate kinase family protein n=1 Tax=Microbacterium sp. cx-55 TaxID=2875948 RepID=UPI001CC053A0|nr:carbohydrate kinase [Microbacterium sp. cx-55]MBZ4486751.1 carbohydrate kinase [Microbacterium sp. cx-55]UGB36292.1 carbohydrate kinase [Microbacterium sp. cx-55]